MTVTYEYRCDECGSLESVTAETKKHHGSADGSHLDLACFTTNYGLACSGTPRRVWGAAVMTASVDGFYANATHGKKE